MRNSAKLVFLVILGFVASHLAWRQFFAAPEDSLQWRFREAQILLEDGPRNFWNSRYNPYCHEYRPGLRLSFDGHSMRLLLRALQVSLGDLKSDKRHAEWLHYRSFWLFSAPPASFDDAERLCLRALSIRLKAFGEFSTETADSVFRLGDIHKYQGKFHKSRGDYLRAYLIRERIVGADHKDSIKAMAAIAGVEEQFGQLDSAEVIYRELWNKYKSDPERGILNGSCNYLPEFLVRTKRDSKAAILYEDILAVQRKIKSAELINTLVQLSDVYWRLEEYSRAEPFYIELLNWNQRTHGQSEVSTLLCMERYGGLLYRMKRFSDAEREFQRSVSLSESANGWGSRIAAYRRFILGCFYKDTCQFSKAEELLQESVRVSREAWKAKVNDRKPNSNWMFDLQLSGDTTHYLDTLWFLSDVKRAMAKNADAEVLARESLVVASTDHRESLRATAMNVLGLTLKLERKYHEAEPLLVESLKIRRKVLGEENIDTLVAMTNLAALYVETNDLDKAQALSSQAVDIGFRNYGNCPTVLAFKSNYSCVLSRLGRNKEAIELDTEVLNARRNRLGNDNADIATSLNNLASAYCHQKRYLEAKPLYEEALKVRLKILGEVHPHTRAVRQSLKLLNKAMQSKMVIKNSKSSKT